MSLASTVQYTYISTFVVDIFQLLQIFEIHWNQFTKHQILVSKLQLNVETTPQPRNLGESRVTWLIYHCNV